VDNVSDQPATLLRCPMCAIVSAVTVGPLSTSIYKCPRDGYICPRDGFDCTSLAADIMAARSSFMDRRPPQDPSATPSGLICRGTEPTGCSPCYGPLRVLWDESRFTFPDGGDYTLWGRVDGCAVSAHVIGRHSWGAAPPRTGAGRQYGYHQTAKGAATNYTSAIPSNETTQLSNVLKWITIHHTMGTAQNGPATALAVQKRHFAHIGSMGPGADIGYHYIIDSNGEIYEGRPLGIKGSHTESFNGGNIGIAVAGDFEHLSGDTPTIAAVASLSLLVDTLTSRFGIQSVWWHLERKQQAGLGATTCPGSRLIPVISHLRSKYPGPPP